MCIIICIVICMLYSYIYQKFFLSQLVKEGNIEQFHKARFTTLA